MPIIWPMLAAWRQLREQTAVFDKEVRALAKQDPTCRLLVSVPGIGVVSVLAYVSVVEDPARFARSRSVGAYMGLTPRQYQSSEVDRSSRISRCGDTLARTLLYEAAVVILTRVKRASPLKEWAQAIARRSGMGKACVALARKVSVNSHELGTPTPLRGRPPHQLERRDGHPGQHGEHAATCPALRHQPTIRSLHHASDAQPGARRKSSASLLVKRTIALDRPAITIKTIIHSVYLDRGIDLSVEGSP
jgi:hypothetical protein